MEFCVWVTLLTPLSLNAVISGLVCAGYRVSPLSREGIAATFSDASTLIALLVEVVVPEDADCGEDEIEEAANELEAKLKKVLNENKILFHSYVITANQGPATWEVGNVVHQPTKNVFGHIKDDKVT